LLFAQNYVGFNDSTHFSLQRGPYNAYRALLSVGSDFMLEVNTTDHNPSFDVSAVALGSAPKNATEIVKVRRSIVVYDPVPPAGAPHYYYGNLTLTLWSNQTRS
ncbi:MAG: hypothetical protein KGH63_04680, partial [Candidatus Micrarchaeota archaeon]|nr:hypothetical protein [Candidatus Micrarchaeota archaeon]